MPKGKRKASPAVEGEPPPKKKCCHTCGGTDHERSTNKLCTQYAPRTSHANRTDLRNGAGTDDREQVKYKVKATVVKLPLTTLLKEGVPPTFADAWSSNATDYI